MKLSFPTGAQVAAFGRHIVSYAAGAATVGVATHFLNPDQGSQLTSAIGNIISGVNSIVGGAATLIALGSGLYAAWTASPTAQVNAAAANLNAKKAEATPAIVDAVAKAKAS